MLATESQQSPPASTPSRSNPFDVSHVLALEHFHQGSSGVNYGKVYPLKCNLYSNPQMGMFVFTLILTVFFSIIMVTNVFTPFWHRIIGTLLCVYITYRFICLGLSDPGLAVEAFQKDKRIKQKDQSNEYSYNQQASEIYQAHTGSQHNLDHNSKYYGFCYDCNVSIKKRTVHCNICQTCIDGYDHHCIFIGKCVGGKNMWQFKEFLCMTFVTLVYALILSLNMAKVQRIS